jgi:steroid 5-alpha reductase family enzyme
MAGILFMVQVTGYCKELAEITLILLLLVFTNAVTVAIQLDVCKERSPRCRRESRPKPIKTVSKGLWKWSRPPKDR